MTDVIDDVTKITDAMNLYEERLKDVEKQQRGLVGSTEKWRHQLGLYEKVQAAVQKYWYGSRLGRVVTATSMYIRFAKVTSNLSDEFSDLTKESEQLTVIQRKFLVPLMKKTHAFQKLEAAYGRRIEQVSHLSKAEREHKLAIAAIRLPLYALAGILMSVILIFGLLGLAIQGPTGDIVEQTEGWHGLHEALTGISGVLSGQMENVGVIELLAGSIALWAFSVWRLGAGWGFAAVGLFLMKAAFEKTLDMTGSKMAAWMATAATYYALAIYWFSGGSLYTIVTGWLARMVASFTFFFTNIGTVLWATVTSAWIRLYPFLLGARAWLVTQALLLGDGVIAVLTSAAFWLWAGAIAGAYLFVGWITGKFDWFVGLVGSLLLGIVAAIVVGVGAIPAILIGLGIYILGWIGKNWGKILSISKKWGSKLISNLKRLGRRFLTWLMLIPGRVTQAIKDHDWVGLGLIIVEALLTPFAYFGAAVYNIFVSAINALGEIMPEVEVPDWVPGIGGMGFDMGWAPLDYVELAKGGIVTAPTMALIGEAGPEAVIPLDKAGGMGTTNNITMNINVGGVTDRTDKRALAREIGDLLNQEVRRLGGEPTRGRY